MAAIEPLPLPLAPDALSPEVEAWLDHEPTEGAEPVPMPAVDARDLAKYVGARARVERQIAEIEVQAQRHIDQAILWRDSKVKSLRKQTGGLDLILSVLYDVYRKLNPKGPKTLTAPYGVTVKARAVPAAFERTETGVGADAALVAWLRGINKDAPPHTKVKVEPKWGELKAELIEGPKREDGTRPVIYKPTGEALPAELGIVFHPAGESEPKVEVAAEGDGVHGR